MTPDFNVMTKSELRAYVLEHREDAEAFEALADRIYANPNPQWYQPEDTAQIVTLIQASKQRKIAE
jgi:predicted O-methyltransferase YrrM